MIFPVSPFSPFLFVLLRHGGEHLRLQSQSAVPQIARCYPAFARRFQRCSLEAKAAGLDQRGVKRRGEAYRRQRRNVRRRHGRIIALTGARVTAKREEGRAYA